MVFVFYSRGQFILELEPKYLDAWISSRSLKFESRLHHGPAWPSMTQQNTGHEQQTALYLSPSKFESKRDIPTTHLASSAMNESLKINISPKKAFVSC